MCANPSTLCEGVPPSDEGDGCSRAQQHPAFVSKTHCIQSGHRDCYLVRRGLWGWNRLALQLCSPSRHLSLTSTVIMDT